MGFGYNPSLREDGERFEIIDYFRWMQLLGSPVVLWNAGCYYIVNRTKLKRIPEELIERREASTITDILVEQLSYKQDIMENTELRQRYLTTLRNRLAVRAEVINAYNILPRESFKKVFDECLRFFKSFNTDDPLVTGILPRNANRVNALYAPLEMAEALWLYREKGIRVKFGPQTEKPFDDLVGRLMENLSISYVFIRCPNPPEGYRTAYLGGAFRSICFSDIPETIVAKFQINTSAYREWLESMLEAFYQDGDLERNIVDLCAKVNEGLK